MESVIDPAASGVPLIFMALILIVGLAATVLWIWSLIHCIRNRFLNDNNRIIGIVLIVVLGLIGSLIYLFLPKEDSPQR